MRKFALFMAVLGTCFAALAVPAKPGKHTFTQSDGTTITVQNVGDEWHHSLVTEDGLTIIRTDNGDFVYRTPSGASNVLAHNAGQRTANEQAFLAANDGNLTMQALETQQQKARRTSARKVSGPKKVGSTQVPNTGSPRVPIILIQYKDVSMKNSKSAFEAQYKTSSKSVYQYFTDQSNGKYTPQFDVYGIYTLDSNRSVYGGNDNSGNDQGLGRMVEQAITKAGNDIDWSLYDNDGDEEADVCIVVYAGGGEAQTGVSNQVWPCQWDLASAQYYGYGDIGAMTRNGVTINKFAVFNELSGSTTSTMDGIGTFCHEFSHCLGLPDWYETTYSNGYYGMDYWSLMNTGCYNGLTIDGDTPIGYSAYEKNFMSWIDLINAVPGTKYTLDVFNQKSEATDQAVKIVSPLNQNEYFILENRQQQGWDVCIQDEGVMINHVTYVASRWEDNTVNNKAVQLMTIIPADNSLSTSTNSGDLWPNGSKTEFTDSSTPASKLNMKADGSLASSTGGAGYLSKPVTEFTMNNDGTVSFWYMKGEISPLDAPVLADATNVGNTSFKATWSDNIDIAHTYTLLVNVKAAVQTLLSTTFGSGHGWTTSGSTTDYTGYTQLGSRSSNGSVTSPSVTPQSNKLTVSINAAYYNTDNSSVKVSVLNGSTTVGTYTHTLTSSYADYAHVYDVTAGTAYTVKIETTATRKRVNLASATISSGDATAASAPAHAVSETGDANSRTITGITAKNYTVNDLTPGKTYEFKVKAVPVDESEASESEFSNVKEVTLSSDPVPALSADPTTIEMGEVTVGQSATGAFTVSAENLTGNVSIALTGSNAFSLDKSSLTAANANGAVVNVTFTPTEAGTFTATATLSNADVDDVVVNLSGSAVLEKHDPVMQAADETKVGSTSFTADWTDETPAANVTSYTLQVNEKAAIPKAILTETFDGSTVTNDGTSDVGSSMNNFADNTGWTGSKVYKAPSGVKLGSSTAIGTLTSPSLNLSGSNGKVTVRFNANYYGTDASSVKLASGDKTAVTQEISSTAADYVVVLDCNDANAQTVTFSCTASKKRFYIYNVEVFSGDVAEALTAQDAPARATETGDASVRTVTGITAKTYTVSNLNEGATYSYKVKAVYADNTESGWSNVEEVTLNEVPTPELTVDPTTMTLEAIAGSTDSDSFEVLGVNLQGDVTLSFDDNNTAFSLNTYTIAKADAEQGATLTVSFNPTEAGNYSATLLIASPNAESVTMTITATAVTPALEANPTNLTIEQTVVGQSNSATFTVQGTNLLNDVILSIADGSVFGLDSYVIEQANAEQGATVTVNFTPTEAGDFTATINIDSDGAQRVTVNVTATAVAPELSASPASLSFEVVEGQSQSESFIVIGANLLGAVTVTLNDDNNVFSIDQNTVDADATNSPTVTVTFAPQTAGEYSGTVTLSSANVEDVVIPLTGVATLDKEVPEMEGADQQTVTDRSFVATWTAVPNVESYTLQVNKVNPANGAAAHAPQETGDANSRTVTGITETSYTVANLDRASTYQYKVKAVYTDGTESDWSNAQTVTTKVKTGIDVIAASGRVALNGRVLTGDEYTRVYNVAGMEIPAENGTWNLSNGIYLISTPEGVAKVHVK